MKLCPKQFSQREAFGIHRIPYVTRQSPHYRRNKMPHHLDSATLPLGRGHSPSVRLQAQKVPLASELAVALYYALCGIFLVVFADITR